MECFIPPGFETVEYEGETLRASTTGRGEVELIEDSDGQREVYVQYHGLLKSFEPERSPPRPVIEWGSISGICRAFMKGDRREFADLMLYNMTQPVTFEGGASSKSFTHSRNKVQEAVLGHLNLRTLIKNGTAVCGSKYKRLVLVNPSVSAVNYLYSEQSCNDYDVVFRASLDELDCEDLYAGYLLYKAKIEVVLDEINWTGKLLPEDHCDSTDLFYCGFNCEYWEHYDNSITIELSPSAYTATGRKFDMVEEDKETIRYTNVVYSQSQKRVVSGKYSKACNLYRYTPDQLERYFSNVYDVTHWGMHGVLTTVPVPEWSYKSCTDIPVVRGACMLGARPVVSNDLKEAQKIVKDLSQRKISSVVDVEDKIPYLEDDIALYNVSRYYVFDHMRVILDTGARLFFKNDPGGPVSFMGSNYSLSDRVCTDLIIRRDNRGQFKYKSASYTVVWHKSMYHMHGDKTLVMMPQTSIVGYVSGSRMFANDKMFDGVDTGGFEIVTV